MNTIWTCTLKRNHKFRFFSSDRPNGSDYYQILGIPPNADKKEIKRQFFSLSLKYHPDRSKEPNSKEIYLKITEAYSTLYDDAKRREYDRKRLSQSNHQYTNDKSFYYRRNRDHGSFNHHHDFWRNSNTNGDDFFANNNNNNNNNNPRQYSRKI